MSIVRGAMAKKGFAGAGLPGFSELRSGSLDNEFDVELAGIVWHKLT